MAVGMIYGDYDFSTYGPIPVFTYSRAVEQTPGDTDGILFSFSYYHDFRGYNYGPSPILSLVVLTIE